MKTDKVKKLYQRYLSLETEISQEIAKSSADKDALDDFKVLAGEMILGADLIAKIARDPSIMPQTLTH